MRPLRGRSLPLLMPDPGGVTCLLAIFGIGGTISPISHYAPGGTISPISHYALGGYHSINMRPLWGRFLPFLMPDPGGFTCLLAIFGLGGSIFLLYHYAPGGHHSINMRPYGVDLYLTTILIILFGTTIIFTTVRPSVHFLIGSSSIAAALMSSSLP